MDDFLSSDTRADRAWSVRYLQERTGQDDSEVAARLADTLGDFPLALAQAGAYIRQTGITVAHYLELYHRQREQFLGTGQPVGADQIVATTWNIACEKVKRVPLARALLRLCAFLAPDHIPRDFIAQWPAAADSLRLNRAIEALRAYALLDVTSRDSIYSSYEYRSASTAMGYPFIDARAGVSLHRFVQEATRQSMRPRKVRKFVREALRLAGSSSAQKEVSR